MFTLEYREASQLRDRHGESPTCSTHTHTLSMQVMANVCRAAPHKVQTRLNTSPRGQTAAAMVKHFKQQVCKECFCSSNKRSFCLFFKDFIAASHATVCKQTLKSRTAVSMPCTHIIVSQGNESFSSGLIWHRSL